MPAHRALSLVLIRILSILYPEFLGMAICSLAAFILFLLSLATTSVAQSRYQQKILVLGGDGMLGSETVARLKLRGHDITILHRGTWYWDSALRIKPWVNFVQCDREDFDVCADKLGDITREKGMFDAVIDFSGYKPSHIKVNRGPLSHAFYNISLLIV